MKISKQLQLQLSSISGFIGCMQFLFFSMIAMLFYGGGTAWNKQAYGYTFWHNAFSDLGKTVSYSGVPNTVSSPIFNSTLSLLGLTLIVFYVSIPKLYKEKKLLGYIIGLFGIISATGLIVIGLTPDDINSSIHMLGVWLWGIPLFLVTVSVIIADLITQNPNRIHVIFTAGLSVAVFIHILQGLSNSWSPLTLSTQKVVVYYNIAWYILFSRRMWLHSKLIST
tara:strand:- start:69 stop:740 length:672 start_codon:yes stop_codon:yes gene_type:complete